jgi:hypothetical protein
LCRNHTRLDSLQHGSPARLSFDHSNNSFLPSMLSVLKSRSHTSWAALRLCLQHSHKALRRCTSVELVCARKALLLGWSWTWHLLTQIAFAIESGRSSPSYRRCAGARKLLVVATLLVLRLSDSFVSGQACGNLGTVIAEVKHYRSRVTQLDDTSPSTICISPLCCPVVPTNQLHESFKYEEGSVWVLALHWSSLSLSKLAQKTSIQSTNKL